MPTRGCPCCPISLTVGPEGCELVAASLPAPCSFLGGSPRVSGSCPSTSWGEGDLGLLASPRRSTVFGGSQLPSTAGLLGRDLGLGTDAGPGRAVGPLRGSQLRGPMTFPGQPVR